MALRARRTEDPILRRRRLRAHGRTLVVLMTSARRCASATDCQVLERWRVQGRVHPTHSPEATQGSAATKADADGGCSQLLRALSAEFRVLRSVLELASLAVPRSCAVRFLSLPQIRCAKGRKLGNLIDLFGSCRLPNLLPNLWMIRRPPCKSANGDYQTQTRAACQEASRSAAKNNAGAAARMASPAWQVTAPAPRRMCGGGVWQPTSSGRRNVR